MWGWASDASSVADVSASGVGNTFVAVRLAVRAADGRVVHRAGDFVRFCRRHGLGVIGDRRAIIDLPIVILQTVGFLVGFLADCVRVLARSAFRPPRPV